MSLVFFPTPKKKHNMKHHKHSGIPQYTGAFTINFYKFNNAVW